MMAKIDITNDMLNEAGKAMFVQQNQRNGVQNQLDNIQKEINNLSDINDSNLDELNSLLSMAELICNEQGIDVSKNDCSEELQSELYELTEEERNNMKVNTLSMLETIRVDDNTSWKEYISDIEEYAFNNDLDVSKDPFDSLLTENQKHKIRERIKADYTMKKANCDKYDYWIAAFCGVAAGLIDVFFVSNPKETSIGKWTDEQTDNIVMKFSKMVGWRPKEKNENNIASAIGFLEKKFKVNYDQKSTTDVNNKFSMGTKNHHMKSLSHSPDIIGLFFSLIDQFQGKSSFVDNGKLIRIDAEYQQLYGNNLIAKIFCGFCNWLGHIMSDIAGSTGSRGNGNRGTGVVIPFFELFGLCDFGEFQVKKDRQNLATIMTRVFQEGYDARFGAAMAVPVVINEMFIRILWTIKSKFYHKNSWKESIPFGNNSELRRMLLVGHGSLCIIDGIDAGIRSKGEILNFVLHLNLVAWSRLALAGLKEVNILYKESGLDIESMDKDIELEWNKLYKEMK